VAWINMQVVLAILPWMPMVDRNADDMMSRPDKRAPTRLMRATSGLPERCQDRAELRSVC